MENTDHKKSFTLADFYKSFNPDFFDEDFCRMWVLNQIHKTGPCCPVCCKGLTKISEKSFYAGKKVVCRFCDKKFTALTGTFLSGSHLKYKELILIMLMFHLEIESTEILKHVDLKRTSLNVYRKKFKEIQESQAL